MTKTKLKKYLEKEDISIIELAYKTGIAYSTLHQYVMGTGNPRKASIDKILKQLKCEYKDVF